MRGIIVAAVIGVILGTLTVLKQRDPGSTPKPPTELIAEPAVIGWCPQIENWPETRCLYRPDGTIEAFERSDGTWEYVE